MAVAILTVATNAICIPMNPAYQPEEVDRYFTNLRPRALIAQTGINLPAVDVARTRGIRVIELLASMNEKAGLFTLIGEEANSPADELIDPGDVAVLLLTSGTTARPKIVPQTHTNICASAYSSVAAWSLTENDRCVNILPLFHGHGLHNTLMASMAAGASVVCTPGFDANSFFSWLSTFQPTWFSAVPTIHKAILARARRIEHKRDFHLRFVRSGSAPLPPHDLMELESLFEAPVIEYYAMTETVSTPIASNPLPPAKRKPGSAGKPVSLDVAIMDETGTLLTSRQTGEVIVRGTGVALDYFGDTIATKAAFANGWLRTGDLGFFDDDGYLFLAGRIREIVNRGGEKITPQEVEEVLLQHSAVAEAVTFAVPHATLGEDVASAVVLRPDCAASPKDIRQFVIGRIADFKVPRQVFIVTEIPKGPTGKLKRIGLAEKLGLTGCAASPTARVAPRTPLEKVLAELWAEVLGLQQVGIHDDFFLLGGDSLSATLLLIAIDEKLHLPIDVARFFEASTVAEVGGHIERLRQAGQLPQTSSAIVSVTRENGVVPASISQERLRLLQQALPNMPFFNILYALRLLTTPDLAVLEKSINEIVRRHEILRTTLTVLKGKCVQVIAPQLVVPLGYDDISVVHPSKKEKVGRRLLEKESLCSFDLTKGPLIRARLVRFARREHLLLIAMHQVVCDGWSLGVFVKELVTLYDAFFALRESPLAPLSIQYADFAHWQRQWESHPEMTAQSAYWREQLRGPLPRMRLATSRAKRTIDDLRTARRVWALPGGLAAAAKRFSDEGGGTLFMAIVAALKTLLHHYLGQDDIRVATNVANRTRPEAEELIGPLVNTVILRTNLGGDPSAQEALRRVRATILAALANQDLPIEQVAAIVGRENKIKPPMLANMMILFQNATLRPLAGSGRELAFEEANANMLMPLVTLTTFDVIVMLRETPNGLVGTCAYKPHLFTAKRIDRLLRDFEDVLEQMATRPTRPISTIRVSRNSRSPASS